MKSFVIHDPLKIYTLSAPLTLIGLKQIIIYNFLAKMLLSLERRRIGNEKFIGNGNMYGSYLRTLGNLSLTSPIKRV